MAQSNKALLSDDNTVSDALTGDNVDRRERLHHTIRSLMKLRQDVIVSYCQMAGVSSFDKRDLETRSVEPSELRSFCQIMVDYTAMGHFEIYQRIIDGKERRKAVKVVAESAEEVEMLQGDLEKLGQIISVRGELEDKLLEALAR